MCMTWCFCSISVCSKQVFQGNTNADGHVKNRISNPFHCVALRILPITWVERAAMRTEVYGCDVHSWETVIPRLFVLSKVGSRLGGTEIQDERFHFMETWCGFDFIDFLSMFFMKDNNYYRPCFQYEIWNFDLTLLLKRAAREIEPTIGL